MKNITKIKLDDEFTVQSDPYCWVLTREAFGEINPRTGKPKRSVHTSYFPDLKTALAEYLDLSCKPSSEVLEMIARLAAAQEKIEEVLGRLEGKRIGHG